MPGLLRGVARTAVVAGTATAVGRRVARRQDNRWAQQQDQQYPPPQQQYAAPQQQYAPPQQSPTPSAPSDTITQLQQLAELKSQGILTEAEFEAQKAKVLAS